MNIEQDGDTIKVDGIDVASQIEWTFPDDRTRPIWTARQPDSDNEWIEHLHLIVESILIEHSALISGERLVEELKRYLTPQDYIPTFLFSPSPWTISEGEDTTSIRDARG
jgi:hypothetical protein